MFEGKIFSRTLGQDFGNQQVSWVHPRFLLFLQPKWHTTLPTSIQHPSITSAIQNRMDLRSVSPAGMSSRSWLCLIFLWPAGAFQLTLELKFTSWLAGWLTSSFWLNPKLPGLRSKIISSGYGYWFWAVNIQLIWFGFWVIG